MISVYAQPIPDSNTNHYQNSQNSVKNVLHIICDDLSPHFRAYQPTNYPWTPNINRLYNEGTDFTFNWCNYPSCGPSRTSFLSGVRPMQTGYESNVSEHEARQTMPHVEYIPEFFQRRGYYTVGVGKIFHGTDLIHYDTNQFHEYYYQFSEDTNLAMFSYEFFGNEYFVFEDSFKLRQEEVGEEALQGLANARASAKPWYVAIGFWKPHQPWNSHLSTFNSIDGNLIQFPIERELVNGNPPEWKNGYTMFSQPNYTTEVRQELCRGMFASLKEVDNQIGMIWDWMDQYNYWTNTIVILSSDHGYALGENHVQIQKNGVPTAKSRTPLVIRMDGKQGGTTNTNLTQLVDIFPTLVEYTQLPPPSQKFDGHSLLNLIGNEYVSGWDRDKIFVTRHVGSVSQRAVIDYNGRYFQSMNAGHSNTDPKSGNSMFFPWATNVTNFNNVIVLQDSYPLNNMNKNFYAEYHQAARDNIWNTYQESKVYFTNIAEANLQDMDGDSIPNHVEIMLGLNAYSTDSDNDGVTDDEEAIYVDNVHYRIQNLYRVNDNELLIYPYSPLENATNLVINIASNIYEAAYLTVELTNFIPVTISSTNLDNYSIISLTEKE